MQNSEIRKIIEALLFSSPEPLTQTRVNGVFNPDTPNLKKVVGIVMTKKDSWSFALGVK